MSQNTVSGPIETLDFDALLTPAVGAARAKDHPLLWTSGVMAIAVILLLAFNAESPRSWTAQLSPNAASQAARSAAQAWSDETVRLGLAAPRSILRGLWEKAQAVTWPADAPARKPTA